MGDANRRRQVPSVGTLLSVTAVAVILATVLASVLSLAELHSGGVGEQITQILGAIAAALFLGAGVLRVSRWRIARDPRSLLMGAALIVLGGVSLPLTSLAGVIIRDEPASQLRAATAVWTTGVAMVLVLRALTSTDNVIRRAVRELLWPILLAVSGFLALLALHLSAPELMTSQELPAVVVGGSVLALCWLYLGLEAALRSDQRPWAGRVSPLLGCMGVAEALRVVSAYHGGGWAIASATLMATMAAITAQRSLLDLDEAATLERVHLDSMAEALQDSRDGHERQHARREEMIHDARNALAGLRAALTTLERYDGVLDAHTSGRLRTAALGEISHLEHLIIRGDEAATVPFDVSAVVAAVVETQRANGVIVTLHDSPVHGVGHPGDLATALQNLLVNARDHGGNNVTVYAASMPGRVEIYVADLGPGLAESQLPTLFQRGARGPASSGSGLGLHVSRALMRRQGGDLELRCHQGGAVFALVLAAAEPVVADLAARGGVPAGRSGAAPLGAPIALAKALEVG